MKSFRDLEIYNESKSLAIQVHKMTLQQLPKFEMLEEGNQIRRSSKSVTALIVEGYGPRKYKADFVKYLIQSIAECDETIVHLDFLYETKSLKSESEYFDLKEKYDLLSKKINKFTQWVEQNWNQFEQTD
jgi:four helix bundle protein